MQVTAVTRAAAVVVTVLAVASLAAAEISAECQAKPQCMLTSNHCQKPVPSLTQCYKYNQESCCVAGHDAVIKSEYDALWSSTCVREYANLELLYCLGCNLDQGSFVDVATKTVRVCQSFADQLFDGATTARAIYDNCGVLLQDGSVLLPGVAKDAAAQLLFPNASTFLNYKYSSGGSDHYPFRSPFFKDFTFQVVPDASDCFTSGAAATVLSVLALAIVAALALVMA